MKTATTGSVTDRTEVRPRRRGMRKWLRLALAVASVYLLVVVGLGVYWSIQPPPFDVKVAALARVGDDPARLVPGSLTVATVGQVARTLLEKPGGYLYNDAFPPGSFVDNMPSWEYGAIKEVRDSLHALRNDFSRSQTQSMENSNLRKADEFLNWSVDSWFLPSPSEVVFRDGIEELDRYFDALVAGKDPSAAFYVRADNLAAYLAVVEKRLGSFAQRLSASVGDFELTSALVSPSEEAPAETSAPLRAGTPWLEIDNVFYEARGYAWALLHTFKALAIEFEPVLRDKNAVPTMQQVIRDLELRTSRAPTPPFSTCAACSNRGDTNRTGMARGRSAAPAPVGREAQPALGLR